jgi:hypothetical protein
VPAIRVINEKGMLLIGGPVAKVPFFKWSKYHF